LVAGSSEPWRDDNYLFSHGPSRSSFLLDVLTARKKDSDLRSGNQQAFIGASQARFEPNEPEPSAKPSQPDRQTLESLPYH